MNDYNELTGLAARIGITDGAAETDNRSLSDRYSTAPRNVLQPVSAHTTAGSAPAERVAVLILANQLLRDDLAEVAVGGPSAIGAEAHARSVPAPTAIRINPSIPDLLRAIHAAQEDYLVFSRRAGLIWDKELLRRVTREIAAVEALGVPWLFLCADGMDLRDGQYAAAFFHNEPSIIPDRGRRLIVQTVGTLCVVKTKALRMLGLQPTITPDLVAFVNALIAIGYPTPLHHYIAVGAGAGISPSWVYNDAYYLETYPDVADAVRVGSFICGFEHFFRCGAEEGRDGTAFFNERAYLAQNPDVASCVAEGQCRSGEAHYLTFGHHEGRLLR